MFIIIINDSKDDNARVRQEIRYVNLFPNTHVSFIGVDSNFGNAATLSASGNLIDTLDAGLGQPGVIAVNVAPRGEQKIDGANGSLFSYFWYKKTLVVSTIKGYNLSLIKKFKLTNAINVLDTKQVLSFASKNKLLNSEAVDHINSTQFRSFEFQPRVAKWLFNKVNIPHKKLSLNNILDPSPAIWYIDSFGNCKLTLTKKHLPCKDAPLKVKTNLGNFNYYERLRDVPAGKTAIYVGSSGIGKHRFLEIATQNTPGSAAKKLKLKVGDEIRIL